MRILILGWYYDDNLGDAVLTECTAALLRQKYPQAELVIRDLMARQQYPERKPVSMNMLLRRWALVRILSLVTRLGWDKQLQHELQRINRLQGSLPDVTDGDFDVAVFAGGQLFMDNIALYVADAVNRLQQRNIPVFFNACGLGPSCSAAIQQRLAAAVQTENVHYVSCRDDVARLNRWCGREIAVPASDTAIYTGEAFGVQKDSQAKTVGLGIMFANTMPLAASFRFWRRLIRELRKRRMPWKIFTNGSEADMIFARRILSSLPELNGPEEQYLCPAPREPAELVRLIASFGSLISYRLHSHIIACSLDIPTVAIQWDRKLPFFFEKIGCPERCLTAKATPKQVLAALEKAQADGYDRAAISSQHADACAKLFEAVDPYLTDRGTL